MTCYRRLKKSLEGALRLPLNPRTKYVLFSDCHRGTGTSNDNFLKNQTLYLAALQHYFRTDYTYIELGDGDELWENPDLKEVIETYSTVYHILSLFHRQGRLHLLYGNHDLIKRDMHYTAKCCDTYPHCCGCNPHPKRQALLPNLKFHEGILLENTLQPSSKKILLTHGHQAELLNSSLWRVARFLVRYLWKPLEHFGILDPTSAAKNNKRKRKTERRLQHFAEQENLILIAGHTHRPFLPEADLNYCNSGSCVHPYGITCLEIEHMHITLVKWSLTARPDMSMCVAREVLAGPVALR